MNKIDNMTETKHSLLGLGGLEFFAWLLSKDKYKCPRCNYPVYKNQSHCPNCGQPFKRREM